MIQPASTMTPCNRLATKTPNYIIYSELACTAYLTDLSMYLRSMGRSRRRGQSGRYGDSGPALAARFISFDVDFFIDTHFQDIYYILQVFRYIQKFSSPEMEWGKWMFLLISRIHSKKSDNVSESIRVQANIWVLVNGYW